nr:helix-turn-helix domain-containing protein [Streptomyces lavendulae]
MRETVGELVRRLRLARGWSQRRLAEALTEAAPGRVPPTRNDVSRWEIGTRSPREWLPFLAQVLQVPREMLEIARSGASGSPSGRKSATDRTDGRTAGPRS